MNHLAHLVLAGPDDGLRLGALLGDHVKGQAALSDWPAGWVAGIRLHRRIDSLCDSHPAVRGFVAGLEPPWRRYGGIMLDVLFDTMLSRHWQRFGPMPLSQFAREIDSLFLAHREHLPRRLGLFSVWAQDRSLWQRYQDPALLAEIFQRIADRHNNRHANRHANRHGRESPLARGLELLDRHDAEIERVFLKLFVDLVAATRHWRTGAAKLDGPDQSSMSSM